MPANKTHAQAWLPFAGMARSYKPPLQHNRRSRPCLRTKPKHRRGYLSRAWTRRPRHSYSQMASHSG